MFFRYIKLCRKGCIALAGLLIVQFQINLRIEKLGVELNDRQRNTMVSAFIKGFINNQIYREVNSVSDETSRQELFQLVEKCPDKSRAMADQLNIY